MTIPTQPTIDVRLIIYAALGDALQHVQLNRTENARENLAQASALGADTRCTEAYRSVSHLVEEADADYVTGLTRALQLAQEGRIDAAIDLAFTVGAKYPTTQDTGEIERVQATIYCLGLEQEIAKIESGTKPTEPESITLSDIVPELDRYYSAIQRLGYLPSEALELRIRTLRPDLTSQINQTKLFSD
ncbi:hypothetical protein HYV86_00720 [Candidatus Woesearchaeota archaeon]|nr:hypothetical protein [Candidatus Woesearchaeota archaeon]